MIEAAFAQKFIEQVTHYTGYNINIMNENGVIIASRNPERVGTFHEVAYRIVTGKEDMVVTSTENEYPGVLPGINMVITMDGKREGVVGITGEPEKVKPVALITKMSVEAMLKYERQQESQHQRFTRKDRFFSLLTQVEHADSHELRSLAKDLGYSENLYRIPILCHVRKTNSTSLLGIIKTNKNHSSEDISFAIDENHLLVFKTIQADFLVDAGRDEVEAYLKAPLKLIDANGIDCNFYVGSIQTSFSQYYYSYRHCKWLEEHSKARKRIAYFYDKIDSYLAEIVPQSELQHMFNVYAKKCDERFLLEFSEVAQVLISSNYNLVSASKLLGVHKNTLIYRLKKIKNTLGLNPLEKSSDRFFMESLYLYVRRNFT